MTNDYLHVEMKYHGQNIIIDACELETGRFEVMTLYADGKHQGQEIESRIVNTVSEAEEVFRDMLFRYKDQPDAELKGRYAKLRDDLKKAVEAGREVDFGEDGGTCNFDAPSIGGRWIMSKIKQAAKEAGTGVFKWELYGGSRYVFSTPTGAQGNRNCRVSAAMCESLRESGYDVIEYCAMD